MAQATLEGGVIVIDLMKNVWRGFQVMASCHAYSSSVPPFPIVADPSLDLARRLRDLKAFCLAVHPLDDSVRVHGVLEDAFRHVEKMRLAEERRAERFAGLNDPSMVGPDVYLTKPLEVKGFVETVRSFLKAEPATQV